MASRSASQHHIPKGTVSKVTHRLMTKKLISSETLPNNRKEVYFRLTPLGREFVDFIAPSTDRMARVRAALAALRCERPAPARAHPAGSDRSFVPGQRSPRVVSAEASGSRMTEMHWTAAARMLTYLSSLPHIEANGNGRRTTTSTAAPSRATIASTPNVPLLARSRTAVTRCVTGFTFTTIASTLVRS